MGDWTFRLHLSFKRTCRERRSWDLGKTLKRSDLKDGNYYTIGRETDG